MHRYLQDNYDLTELNAGIIVGVITLVTMMTLLFSCLNFFLPASSPPRRRQQNLNNNNAYVAQVPNNHAHND